MFVLYAQGLVRVVFNIARYSLAEAFVMKLPAIVCDIILAFILLKVARKTFKTSRGFLIVIMFLICPAIIMDSVVWGQIDSVPMVFIISSLYLLSSDTKRFSDWQKHFFVSILYVAAILIKLQCIVFAPIYLFYILHKLPKKRILNITLGIILSLILVPIICYPFSGTLNPTWILSFAKGAVGAHNYSSLNAFNIFSMFGLNFKEFASGEINIYTVLLKVVPIFATVLSALLWYGSKLNVRKKAFFIGFILFFTCFEFMPQMHERYIFFAVVFAY
ncbi:glycosyltransferase family 39 protein, partial [Treponema sp. R6D11]